METDILPNDAVKLRAGFKKAERLSDSGLAPSGDFVQVCGRMGYKDRCTIVIFKDGEEIASVPVNKAVLKRLKSELLWWIDTASGLLRPHRGHEKRDSGWRT